MFVGNLFLKNEYDRFQTYEYLWFHSSQVRKFHDFCSNRWLFSSYQWVATSNHLKKVSWNRLLGYHLIEVSDRVIGLGVSRIISIILAHNLKVVKYSLDGNQVSSYTILVTISRGFLMEHLMIPGDQDIIVAKDWDYYWQYIQWRLFFLIFRGYSNLRP